MFRFNDLREFVVHDEKESKNNENNNFIGDVNYVDSNCEEVLFYMLEN